jgi:hypothetical protein
VFSQQLAHCLLAEGSQLPLNSSALPLHASLLTLPLFGKPFANPPGGAASLTPNQCYIAILFGKPNKSLLPALLFTAVTVYNSSLLNAFNH